MDKKKLNQTEHFLFFSKNATLSYNLNKFIDNKSHSVLISSMGDKRKIATHINKIKKNTKSRKKLIRAGHLNGMMLILETLLFVFHKYQKNNPDNDINKLCDDISKKTDVDRYLKTLAFFSKEYLKVSDNPVKITDSEQCLTEEILLLWLANINPAFSDFDDIFSDQILIENSNYEEIIADIQLYYKDKTGFLGNNKSIIDLLLEPSKKSPNSIFGQLKYIVENWGDILGDFILKLLKAIDLIKEEDKYGGMGPGRQHILSYSDIDLSEEREKFSPDKDWMPNLVLIAKTVFVWLYQLSKKYNYNIERLDQIPDKELDELANSGITGLWLIGIWERSRASQKIKQLCGNPEAISSAYSIFEYKVAEELGGESALDNLKYRAEQRGIRLGADMVPNHMGIDSPWVLDKPEHFIHLNYSPYPSHTFNGQDLSSRDNIEIKIEDHYYDRTDASVVFKWRDKNTGNTKYIYHGNDGTSMPWNDTAQLNYLNPEVREAAIQTILSVSKKFPIIRFDAAMTLTKLHYHRLWFPEPGSGGDIPTRAENGMSKGEFSKLMGEEFWSEVVRRVAEESNDTLLLAEAFWLMEAYFVRTLGMHRVYNSAFMNFLKNEENAEFRTSIKNTIEFNPEILKRFVNFLNNPDEETAVVQFGRDDKYFGVTVLVSTLPGLPMFGHGQIEGYAEKYGMEYRKPYWEETPDYNIVERHKREIFPILKKRYMFSGVENFRLYDFYLHNGRVNENVIAYSNRANNESSLIIYNNKYESTAGWIRLSSPYLKINSGTGHKEMVNENLAYNLRLNSASNRFVIFKDFITGLEYIRNTDDLNKNGIFVELNAFKYHIFLNFREVEDDKTKIYSNLNALLNGKGVEGVDRAISKHIFKNLIDDIGKYISYLTDDIKRIDKSILRDIISGILKGAKEINNSEHDIFLLTEDIVYEINLINSNKGLVKDNLPISNNKKHFNILYLLTILEGLKLIMGAKIINNWIIKDVVEIAGTKLKLKNEDIFKTTMLLKAGLFYKNILNEIRKKKLKLNAENWINLLFNQLIKRYLGVNSYDNIEWFNKERAEEFFDFVHYISSIDMLSKEKKLSNSEKKEKLKRYDKILKSAKETILRSKYHFDLLLKYIKEI